MCWHNINRANTYTWDFPDVKFRVPSFMRYRSKQSGSGIRTIFRIGSGLYSRSRSRVNQFVHVPTFCRHATFHPNSCKCFWIILLTDRQTNKQGQKHLPPSLSEVIINNNNNIQDNVYGAIIMAEPLREFTRFTWWIYGAKRPPTQDQARRLRLWVRLCRLPESTTTIANYYYYSTRKLILILPSHRG